MRKAQLTNEINSLTIDISLVMNEGKIQIASWNVFPVTETNLWLQTGIPIVVRHIFQSHINSKNV